MNTQDESKRDNRRDTQEKAPVFQRPFILPPKRSNYEEDMKFFGKWKAGEDQK